MQELRTFSIVLPAGLRLMTSNQRLHWRTRAKVTKGIRGAAMEAAFGVPELQRAHITAVLHPHDRRRRDPANWYPSVKAAVDGIVDAGVLDDDDHIHVLGPDMRLGDIVKGGQLVLVVRELDLGEQWPDLGAVR
jgi:hypothetical protein